MHNVTSTGYGTWKVWYSTSLLNYTKLRKENQALHSSQTYIHSSA